MCGSIREQESGGGISLWFMSKEGYGGSWVGECSLWKMRVGLQRINNVQGTAELFNDCFVARIKTVAQYCGTWRDALGWSAIHMK